MKIFLSAVIVLLFSCTTTHTTTTPPAGAIPAAPVRYKVKSVTHTQAGTYARLKGLRGLWHFATDTLKAGDTVTLVKYSKR